MTTISAIAGNHLVTLITTFTVEPERREELLQFLQDATDSISNRSSIRSPLSTTDVLRQCNSLALLGGRI